MFVQRDLPPLAGFGPAVAILVRVTFNQQAPGYHVLMPQMHQLAAPDPGVGHEAPQVRPSLIGRIESVHRGLRIEPDGNAPHPSWRLDALKRVRIQLLPLHPAPQRGLQAPNLLPNRFRRHLVLHQALGLVRLQLDRAQGVDRPVPEVLDDDPKLALGLVVRGRMLGLVPVQPDAQKVAQKRRPGDDTDAMPQLRFARAYPTDGDAEPFSPVAPVEVGAPFTPVDVTVTIEVRLRWLPCC